MVCIEGMSPLDFVEVAVSAEGLHPSNHKLGAAAGKPVAAGWGSYEANAQAEAQLKDYF